MAIELIRFLGAVLILLVPGILLARVFSLGNNLLERWITGSSVSVALAVYVATLISHFDLRGFYPIWAIVLLGALIAWGKTARARESRPELSVQIWMGAILLTVAITRFAMALPLDLPPGSLDPTFHLILAKQIQLTHHAIDRWPFAGIPLNYPTGSQTLVVILASLAKLPLHTTFKDLIPFLGILTTGQMYVFVRRISNNPLLAVYSAAIYGLWAWYGSIDYFRWGGVPNELAMLLLIALLSIAGNSRGSTILIAICFAAMILVHHHVMVVATIILGLIVVWQSSRKRPRRGLAFAIVVGFILDLFFLVPYAQHLSNFHSTGMVAAGERVLTMREIAGSFGYPLLVFAIGGAILAITRKISCPPVVGIASLSLVAMFVIGEDIVPMTLQAMNRTAFTFFTPSRFLTDLNYFLPIFAAGALVFIRRKLHLPASVVALLLIVAPLVDLPSWISMFEFETLPKPVLVACDWIQHNTPPHTLVDNTGAWMTYLCWREPAHIALPVSEPVADYHPASERIPLIVSGKIPPDSPGQIIVAIREAHSYTGQPILWQDLSGLLVVQEWPTTTSSSSAEVTPAPKPPGQPPASAPASP